MYVLIACYSEYQLSILAKRKKSTAATSKAATPATAGTVTAGRSAGTSGAVQQLSGARILKPGLGKHGKLPPAPPDAYKSLWNEMAVRMGFEDLWELTVMQGYLVLNGQFSFCEVGVHQCIDCYV